MAEKLPKEKLELFDKLIKALSIALTNSALYPPNHPSSKAVMDSLKEMLDACLRDEAKVEIGITPDNIMLNGEFVREESDLFRGVAGHLHRKGIVAVLFTKGVAMDELEKFFGFLKEGRSDKAAAAGKSGAMPHLMIKEVDYSSVLTSGKARSAVREQEMWRSLSDLGKDLRGGQLPRSKIEFMTEFLKDPGRAAAVLDGIYKDAVARIEGQSTVVEVRDLLVRIGRYFEGNPDAGGAGSAKRKLSEIMSKLDTDFVVSLFGDKAEAGMAPDLADEIFKGLPDEAIADFIYSVLKSGGNVTEKLVRVFSRLSPGKGRSESVLSMVTDKLFTGRLLGRGGLSTVQDSIKALFESHGDDGFITQFYDLTVKTFLDRDKDASGKSGIHSAITREYVQYLKPDNMKREKIRLILNILWLEKDPAKFRSICAMLADSFREIPEAYFAGTVREAFELLTDKIGQERMRDTVVAAAVRNALDRLDTPETARKLVSLVTGSDRGRLHDMSYVFARMKESPAGRLLDLFMAQPDDAHRENYSYLLSRFDERIAGDVIAKIDEAAARRLSPSAKALYEVLKEVSFREAHSVAGRLVKGGDSQIRSWILDEYCPATAEEKEYMLAAAGRERDPEIRKKIMITLVKTKDAAVIGRLFDVCGAGIFVKRDLLDLVTLCGTFKVEGSIPMLRGILERRRFPYIRSARTLRAQAVLSLARMGKPEGAECVIRAEKDSDPTVRAMVKIALGGSAGADEKAE